MPGTQGLVALACPALTRSAAALDSPDLELIFQPAEFHRRSPQDHPRNFESTLPTDLAIIHHLSQRQRQALAAGLGVAVACLFPTDLWRAGGKISSKHHFLGISLQPVAQHRCNGAG